MAFEFSGRSGGCNGQNDMAVSQTEDRSADAHYFNTFWVSASSSSKRATSSLRRSTSCSSWLRLFACARWEATRLCFRLAFSSALRGGKQTEPTVTGLSKLLCEECKAPSEGEETRGKKRRRRSLQHKHEPEKKSRREKKDKMDHFR